MPHSLDDIDRRILAILQKDGKTPLSKVGSAVGLSSPAATERVRKLEQSGVIRGTHAQLDGRAVGLDITAFIGIGINYPTYIEAFLRAVAALPDVLECHHVTGRHTLLLKAKTENTASLEKLISSLRGFEGVEKTDTMLVLSTHSERTEIQIPHLSDEGVKKGRARARKNALAAGPETALEQRNTRTSEGRSA